ncbi:hypothetical protein J0X15_15645 [Roseibium sp. CAU 1637]|uniref:ATP-grasp domain-containing protein n=1 Tax=Roseibium limicola TaxID=2816037 RepID=A0A939EQI2_9HYPH|nr:hypothetical protein [Roseibium limicola]MBO0346663.1 hypothetical protein [Roseibium limicola]
MSGSSLPLVARLLSGFCHDHGLALQLDAGLGHAGYIEAPNGRRSCFIGTRFDLNPMGASELVKDKAYTAEFLRRNGLPTPDDTLLLAAAYRDRLYRARPEYLAGAYQGPDMAEAFATKTGFPLYLKPNTGSGGKDVERVDNSSALSLALARLSETHETLLLQQAVTGADLRLVCLDGRILCALLRQPATLTGDGVTDLRTLVQQKKRTDADLARIERHLMSTGRALTECPEAGEDVTLLPLTNLSAGGTATLLHPDKLSISLKEACLSAGRTFGLRYYAVDLIAQVPEHVDAPFHILEINSAPGLAELHRQGGTSAALAEEIYQEVFLAIKRDLLED